MQKLKEFIKNLEAYRKPPSDDPYDKRITHCYLSYEHEGKTHHFEVRGWAKKIDSEGILKISVVNWTLCAGPAHISMTEDIVEGYKILESITAIPAREVTMPTEEKLKEENFKLKECLKFYANSLNYSALIDYKGMHYVSVIGSKFELGEDNGTKARELLKELECFV